MDKKKILVIDDNEDYLTLTGKRLEGNGYKYYGASNIEKGLSYLDSVKPDLVLLDLLFDGQKLSGSSFLSVIKGRVLQRKNPPPVIVISALHDKEVMDYALENGASEFIDKPYNPEILISTIEKYCPKSKKKD